MEHMMICNKSKTCLDKRDNGNPHCNKHKCQIGCLSMCIDESICIPYESEKQKSSSVKGLLSEKVMEQIIQHVAKEWHLETYLFHTKPNVFNIAIAKASHDFALQEFAKVLEEDFEDKDTLWTLNIAKFRWKALKKEWGI
jgi:hypothetical protein